MTESITTELMYMLIDLFKIVVDIFDYAEAWGTFIAAFIIFCVYRFILSPFLGSVHLSSDTVIDEGEVVTGMERKKGRSE